MSSLNGRNVSYARAHGTIKVPFVPQIGPELSETGNAQIKAVKMSISGDNMVLSVIATDGPDKGKPVEIYVPLTNFSHFTVKPEAKVAKDSKA